MAEDGFWDDPSASRGLLQERARLEATLATGRKLLSAVEDADTLVELGREGLDVDARRARIRGDVGGDGHDAQR
jgi:hypothetical protein